MERTLFDETGHPIAYIADDGESSIYLWDGHAVAYLVGDLIYGWNGHHIGWFSDGIAYDTRGNRVGSLQEKCQRTTYTEPTKYTKFTKYTKHTRHTAHSRPTLSNSFGKVALADFLRGGSV